MRKLSALASLLLLVGTAHAATDAAPKAIAPNNAREAVVLFAKVCVNSLGKLPQMNAELEKLNKAGIANKLKPEAAAQVVSATQKDNAWVIVSPETKQRLMITHDSIGICGLHVHAADASAMVKEYDGLVNAFAAEAKGTVTAKKPISKDGSSFYYKEVKTSVGPLYSIALSTSAKATKGTQHMLTFARSSGN